MRLTIDDICKSFGSVKAVDHVSLNIDEGELFYLLGPSGCGKTTLLRMIAGFIAPDQGRIMLGEKDITRIPARTRDSAMVFQNFALWPHMSVQDNIAFGLKVRKVDRGERERRVQEALNAVQLSGYGKRRPHELSGGQQQRVAFARALVVRPGILLLDEPLSSLDARLRVEMRSEIRRICTERRQTTVCVTHDQKEALAVADRIAIMASGIVIQCGTPREIYEHPRTSEIADFLGECNIFSGRADGRDGDLYYFDTPVGRLAARRTVDGNPDQVKIAFRPENVVPASASRDSANTLTGSVVREVYQGDATHYEVAVGRGQLQITALPDRRLAADQSEFTFCVDPIHVNVMES